MIDQKQFIQGLALLRPLGLKKPEDLTLNTWLKFFNDIDPFNDEKLIESQRLNITQEEFVEACKHLVATNCKLYTGSNIVAILINQIKKYRKEQDNKRGIPNNIKPIPTSYRNINFRSQLEAHWALFFDSIGWSYVYEPNQFDLGKYKYKPDFLLSDFDIYIEIKPKKITDDDLTVAVEKCQLLQLYTKKRVWLVRGNPAPFDFLIFNDRGSYSYPLGLSECVECHSIILGYAWYKHEGANLISEVPIKNKTQISQVEKIGGKQSCNCANITQYEQEDLVTASADPTEEHVDLDFEECLEEPLPIDDPESPDFISYRHNDLKLEEIEAGYSNYMRRAFLEVHRLKNNDSIFLPMHSEEEYGEIETHEFFSESAQILKELSKGILKPFPKK